MINSKRNGSMGFNVEYRNIKNINLYVKPPDGHILITAPHGTPKKRIINFVKSKEEWILKAQKRVAENNANYDETPRPSRDEIEILREHIINLADKWESAMGVHASKWTIRHMKTRWGSCNVDTGRISINSRLIYYPPECLEYIVVHELCHLIEPSHSARFKKYMSLFLPDWKDRQNLLK